MATRRPSVSTSSPSSTPMNSGLWTGSSSSSSSASDRLGCYHQGALGSAYESGVLGRVQAWRGDPSLSSSAGHELPYAPQAIDSHWDETRTQWSDDSDRSFFIPILDTSARARAPQAPGGSPSACGQFRPTSLASATQSLAMSSQPSEAAAGRRISFAPSPPAIAREAGARPMVRRASSPSPLANARPFSGAQGMTRAHSPGPTGANLGRTNSMGARVGPPPVSTGLGSVGMGRRASSPGPGAGAGGQRSQLLGAMRRTVGFDVPSQASAAGQHRGRSPSPAPGGGVAGRRGSLGLAIGAAGGRSSAAANGWGAVSGQGMLSPALSSGMLSRTSSGTSGTTVTGVTSLGSRRPSLGGTPTIEQQQAELNRKLAEDPHRFYGSLETDLWNVEARRRAGYEPNDFSLNRSNQGQSSHGQGQSGGWGGGGSGGDGSTRTVIGGGWH